MIKRLFDIMASLLALVVLSPLILIVAALIRLDSSGPVIFRQRRVGKGGKPFNIYKFRTMIEDASKLGPSITAKEDPRITQIGRILRHLKLDEIPQFWNVLKGDMSLVGPRPEVPHLTAYFPQEAQKIFSVKPGIFGTSQLSNIDEANMMAEEPDTEKFYIEKILPEKIKNDLAYIHNRNPFKDLKILLGSSTALLVNSLKLRYVLESPRRILFLFVDLCFAVLSVWAGFLLRFEGAIPVEEQIIFYSMIPFITLLRAPCFITFGLYQTLWQYLGVQELVAIIKAATAGSLLLPFVLFLLQAEQPPRSVLVIDWFLLIMMLGGFRIFFKLTADRLRHTKLDKKRNVLIVGAEDAGEMLVREYIKRPNLGYWPVGFVDDHPEKIGLRIHGIKVIGKIFQISQISKLKKVDEVVIALSEASPEKIKIITKQCRDLKIPCRIIPQTSALLAPGVLPLKLRAVDISDLLGRELVHADQTAIHALVHDKKILISGAGGSIGSELARVIYQNGPRELVLIDNSENNLYDVQMDLKNRDSETQVSCYLRDVTEQNDMEKIFQKHQPQIVYHAAAFKHVPLVEIHYAKGIINNIQGTRIMADFAKAYGAESFVLISTDKAINPTSLMGATKRAAELYVQSLGGGKTKFLSVRFGNVFNSKGSVVPLFKKQIEEGGPVTVTDPRMKRYFMDVSESVFLILQSTILGSDAEIFVLDMGHAISIVDLAKNLIQMSGAPDKSIEIRFTGLRPGEKIEEELELSSEQAIPTTYKKIKIWRSILKSPKNLSEHINDLIEMAKKGASRDKILQQIQLLVPEYRPYSFE